MLACETATSGAFGTSAGAAQALRETLEKKRAGKIVFVNMHGDYQTRPPFASAICGSKRNFIVVNWALRKGDGPSAPRLVFLLRSWLTVNGNSPTRAGMSFTVIRGVPSKAPAATGFGLNGFTL